MWSLAEVTGACRSAPAVWVALVDMGAERGSATVTPTRERLAELTGIKKHRTISDALTVLAKAHWISREHVPVLQGGRQTATLLRVVLRRGRKTAHTGHGSVEAEKRPIGAHRRRGRKTALDFSFQEKRAGPVHKPRPAQTANDVEYVYLDSEMREQGQ